MFKTHVPAAFISITILPLVNAIAMSFRVAPLSHIAVTKDSLPHACAFLDSSAPFTIVHLAIGPVINSFTMCLSFSKVSLVRVPIAVPFIAFSLSLIIIPLAFVDSIFSIAHDSVPTSLILITDLASIKTVLILLQTKILCYLYFFIIKHV